MGQFNITRGINSLKITLAGKFTPEETAQFLKEFQAEVAKIQPANTELHFSAGDFQVLAAERQDSLKECFQLYHKIGFKKVVIDVGNNAILKMQVKRLAADAGVTNFEIV